MSTRSRIAMEMPDGKIKSIYCHFDGYPEGVGKVLQENYQDPKKIEELLELGDISKLGKFYDERLSKTDWDKYDLAADEGRKLMEETEEATIAYKDRGEDVKARVDESLVEFVSKLGNCGEEFSYLFTIDYSGAYVWKVYETPYGKELTEVLE